MKKSLPFLFLFFFLNTFIFAQCTPPTGGILNAPNTGCSDRVATITVSGVSNATSYTWSIVGASSTKVTETEYNIVYGSGNVSITVTPANGSCAGTPLTKSIIVSASPTKPTITQTGTTLNSTTSTSYQWYLSSNMISGATASTYSPSQNGTYYVESRNANGCSTFSDAFTYFTTAIKEDVKFKSFSFYPNPVQSTLNTVFTEKHDLEFFDTSGRKVLESKNLYGETRTDLSTFNKGIYIMKVTSGGKIATRKMIIK
jgi:hypothetical protein